jgi:hypothetical protein
MSNGLPRRSFLRLLLALLFGPWLARRAAAVTAVPKAAPSATPSRAENQELLTQVTTYTYDWRPEPWQLRDMDGRRITTYVYDSCGRQRSREDKNASS